MVMKNNLLEYKGYHACVSYVSETNTLRGVIEGINDFIDFECADLNEVTKEFHEAVDDYLDFCKSVGKEPEKEYKGSFNIRIRPELHKMLALEASCNGESLNKTVERVIESYFISGVTDDHSDLSEPKRAGASERARHKQAASAEFHTGVR